MMNRNEKVKRVFYMFLGGAIFMLLSAQSAMAVYFMQPNAYWQLEETDPGASGVSDDLSVVDGACSTCPNTTPGQINNGFDFSAADAGVNIANNAIFDFAADTSFSIELWMRIASAPASRQVMIGRYDGSNSTHWWLSVEDDGTVGAFFVDADGPSKAAFFSSSAVADDTWHHVVAVVDAGADKIMLYIDGKLDTTRSQSASDNGSFTSTAIVTLGYHNIGSFYYYGGKLDNVAVYSASALSADVIQQNYLNGLQGRDLDEEFSPVFTGSVSDTIAVGYGVTYQAQAAGNPMPDYSSDNLPTGAAIDASGEITWQPADIQAETHIFDVIATNSQGTGNQTWTIDVKDLCLTDLSGYWKLEEDGGPYVDETGVVADATCSDCPARVEGNIGFGQSFDANDDTINIPANAVFDFAADTSFSIELWMKIASTPGSRQVMIGRDDDTNSTHWWLSVEDNGRVGAFFVDADGPYESAFFSSSAVADDTWHHVVAVVDAGADQIMLYIDGKLETTRDQSESNDGSFISTAIVTLGYHNVTPYFRYNGALDEVAIYNTALSPTIIAQHYNADMDQSYCNAAPTIGGTPITNATENMQYTYNPTASDPEGHDMEWSLLQNPSGMTIDSVNGQVDWMPGEGGSVDVVIQVADQYGATGTQAFTIDVVNVNDAPQITGQVDPGLSTPEETALTITLDHLVVSDPDNSFPADFMLVVQDGSNYTRSGAQITPDAEFSGTLSIPVMVNDGDLDSNVYNLQVAVTTVNDNPVITTTSPTAATVGSEFRYDADATDADSTTLTWSLSAAPGDMVVDSTTGEVTWTPDAGSVGNATFTLRVSDNDGGFDEEIITVTVSTTSGGGGGGGGGSGCFVGSLDF
jgi:hypothetical protein